MINVFLVGGGGILSHFGKKVYSTSQIVSFAETNDTASGNSKQRTNHCED